MEPTFSCCKILPITCICRCSKIVHRRVTEIINCHDLFTSLPNFLVPREIRSKPLWEETFQSEMMMVFCYLISALMGFLFFSSAIGMFELLSSFASMPCKMSTPPQKAIVFSRAIAGEFSWLHSFPRCVEKMYTSVCWNVFELRKLIEVRYS